jgi:hypothetical protein
MPKCIFNHPDSANILEQAVTNVIKAVAIEESAIASILAFEKDMIQKAKNDAMNLEEFVALNESVNGIIRSITKVQAMTQIKLQFVEELLQKIEIFEENDTLEE